MNRLRLLQRPCTHRCRTLRRPFCSQPTGHVESLLPKLPNNAFSGILRRSDLLSSRTFATTPADESSPSTSASSVQFNSKTGVLIKKTPTEAATSTLSSQSLTVRLENGLPVLEVPLPSRDEFCCFVLRPISDTVGSFCDNLRNEDKGVEIAAVYRTDGTRVSRSVSVEHLMLMPHFRLRVNDQLFDVQTPQSNAVDALKYLQSTDRIHDLDDLRAKVATLYAVLSVDEFKLEREKSLMLRLEEVELRLRPLEIIRKTIEEECERYSTNVLWAGFIAMGIQTGIFARLTWWEYSWDIVEPCTYFATFSTVFATFGYYIFTKQSFEYPSAERRLFSSQFNKRAKRFNFDADEYNALKRLQLDLRRDLDRLRDPLQQHLPATRLAALESESAKLRLDSPKSPNGQRPINGERPPR